MRYATSQKFLTYGTQHPRRSEDARVLAFEMKLLLVDVDTEAVKSEHPYVRHIKLSVWFYSKREFWI
jgi:hypothetical protein